MSVVKESLLVCGQMTFPEHKAGFFLQHNEHKNYYEPLDEWLCKSNHIDERAWVSEEQKQKALTTDSLWVMQWYPETPVGSCILAAADLDALLAAARGEK